MTTVANIDLRLVDITPFDRENHHIPTKGAYYVESFFAITLVDSDGNVYVNYTRQDTAFAIYCRCHCEIGQIIRVGFTKGEFRDDAYGPHHKIIRVRVGGYSTKTADKRAAKRAARLAKLGLS